MRGLLDSHDLAHGALNGYNETMDGARDDEAPEPEEVLEAAERVRGAANGRFALGRREPAAEGIRRVARAQIDRAAGRLADHAPPDAGAAVHEARKALKRARAVVRVARGDLGDAVYRRENTALRDAGRRLSGTRDAHVLLETLDALTERYADELPLAAFAGLRSVLAAEDAAAHQRLAADAAGVRDLVGTLEAAGGRVRDWPLRQKGDARALAPGVEWIYRRGRKAQRRAAKDPTTEHLHDLRKRAKDLWYAAEIVRPAAPKPTKRLAARAERVADAIGADHDIAVLLEAAHARAEALAPGELEQLTEVAGRRRTRLQRKALKQAARLYATRPERLAKRLR
jgi:CHAD domain-containing protein